MSVIGVILAAFSRIWTKYWEIRSISEYEDFLRSEPNYCLNFTLQSIIQKQFSRGVLRKRCSENTQQFFRRTPMPKWDFSEVALYFYWNRTSAWLFSCKLLHILRTSLPKNTSGRLLLIIIVAFPHFHNEIKLEVSSTVSELFSRFTTFYRNRAAIRLLMIPINQKTNIKTTTYTENFAGIFLFRIDGNLNGLPLINIWVFFLKFLEYSFSA